MEDQPNESEAQSPQLFADTNTPIAGDDLATVNVPGAMTQSTFSSQAPAQGVAEEHRPQIVITLKRLPEAVALAQQALIAHNVPPTIFSHDGMLVRLGTGASTTPELVPIQSAELRCELTYAARWFESKDGVPKPIYPPSLLVRDLIRRASQWAPALRNVTRVPTYGADWNLIGQPGFHEVDQVFYHPDHQPIPPVPAHPGCAQVSQARHILCDDLLGQFPFVAQSHRAAAVAALIVPFIRDRIDGATPLHLIESPQPGTGKTLLADVLVIPALGKAPAATTEIANGDDLRKWLTSTSLVSDGVVLIDNINARLSGSALAAALTKVEWSDRIVGTSRMAKGSLRCLWLATGNNVTMSTELARRVVRCRLDAGLQRPFMRGGFTHSDLRGWAKANRHELIWAVLVLVRHWIAQGRPLGNRVLGSYEGYCSLLGGILQSAGIDGFLADLDTERNAVDEETIEWAAFINAWKERFGSNRVGTEDLDKELLSVNPEMLATTLLTTASQRGRRVKLGQELRKRRDAVTGRFRLRTSSTVDRHGCWHYWLEAVDEVEAI